MIVADTRWRGNHGIGRYATEVLSRLTVPWTPLAAAGRPSSMVDPLRRVRAEGGAKPSAVYSPGYNAVATRLPQVVTVHDLIHLQVPSRRRAAYLAYYNGFLRPMIRRNRVVLTVSETSKRAIDGWLRDDRVEIVNAGNGCSSAFQLATADEDHRGTGARPYVLFVGNLKPHKNAATVVAALARTTDLDLVMVCSDVIGAQALAQRFGVQNRVRVEHGLDDEQLARLYRSARATLVPSLVEGFGLPALESIACGTPVVYWRGCDSVAEIVGCSGTAVEGPKDIEEWSHALETIPDEIVHYIAERYSWQSVSSRIDQVLKSR